MKIESVVLTIGHSTQPQERFIATLRDHGVTALSDVRSTPYSRMNPQFNREELKQALKAAGIAYVFLGKELGARSGDPSCYEQGRVQYRRLAKSALFQAGIERVKTGSRTHRVALMCAEKEPLECHRAILVARELVGQGSSVEHILSGGVREAHHETMQRLMRLLRMPQDGMFQSRAELERDAYDQQEERIAYVKSEPSGRQGAELSLQVMR